MQIQSGLLSGLLYQGSGVMCKLTRNFGLVKIVERVLCMQLTWSQVEGYAKPFFSALLVDSLMRTEKCGGQAESTFWHLAVEDPSSWVWIDI